MDNINIDSSKEYDISLEADDIKIINLDDYYTKAESDEQKAVATSKGWTLA